VSIDWFVFVTVPGENKIILIAVEFKTFVLRKEITCAVEPSSITSHKDDIYVSSYPWSDKAALYKLTEDGKVKATLDKDNTGKRLFKAPLDIALDKTTNYLFVCDSLNTII
jgi:DNA-binding beta-propeller fold protein YncE